MYLSSVMMREDTALWACYWITDFTADLNHKNIESIFSEAKSKQKCSSWLDVIQPIINEIQ